MPRLFALVGNSSGALARSFEALIDPALLKVLAFHKLGTLPIEADLLLLLLEQDGAELARLIPEFDFMLRGLRRLTVVEYKAPEDLLKIEDVETALCYALLAKRKHKVPSTEEISVQCMFSYCEKGLLQHFARVGLRFVEAEKGVLRAEILAMRLDLINLVELADARPADLVNMLSARHRRFVLSANQAGQEGRRAAILRNLYYSVFKEVRKMLKEKNLGLPGTRELITDIDELNRRILADMSPEERLRDLSPEERLRDLSLEERLRGLSPEERAQLLRLLSQSS